MTEIKSSVQFEVNRSLNEEQNIKKSIEELRELIENKKFPDNIETVINIEKERSIEVEKSLEEKINAWYQYFFKSNSIPI